MTSVEIRRAAPGDDDGIIIEHYLALWDSYGTPSDAYRLDAPRRVLEFLSYGRQALGLAVFLAVVDGKIAGSSGCQLRPDLYPAVVEASHRLNGYIWHVYVEPDHQRRGIGGALTLAAIEHLQSLGCTAALLHYSDAGRALYEHLGFVSGNELRLPL